MSKFSPNFEFGFLVARKLGYNYINLARCGMSNFGIRLQIDYALKHLQPDFMIINATGVNRFEILKDLENKYDHNKRKVWKNASQTVLVSTFLPTPTLISEIIEHLYSKTEFSPTV